MKFKKLMERISLHLGARDREYHRKLYEGRAIDIGARDYNDARTDQNFSFNIDGVEEGEMDEEIGKVKWLEPGGYITFSTDITPQLVEKNINDIAKNILQAIETGKGKAKSIIQRINMTGDVGKIIKKISNEKKKDFGFSVGNMFTGYYYDQKQDYTFNEKSVTIEIRDVSSEDLKDIALVLGAHFDQYEVLVFDSAVNKPYLLTTKE